MLSLRALLLPTLGDVYYFLMFINLNTCIPAIIVVLSSSLVMFYFILLIFEIDFRP